MVGSGGSNCDHSKFIDERQNQSILSESSLCSVPFELSVQLNFLTKDLDRNFVKRLGYHFCQKS